MKKLLLLLLVSICLIGWRSETVMQALGVVPPPAAPSSVSAKSLLAASPNGAAPTGMTLQAYAELAKTDPDAYNKFLQSHQVDQERSEVDKLMNFFTRLKYE